MTVGALLKVIVFLTILGISKKEIDPKWLAWRTGENPLACGRKVGYLGKALMSFSGQRVFLSPRRRAFWDFLGCFRVQIHTLKKTTWSFFIVLQHTVSGLFHLILFPSPCYLLRVHSALILLHNFPWETIGRITKM